jgi:hypothetical protein
MRVMEQYEMLCETMKRFNEACNRIAETAFAMHSANNVEIHKTDYYPVRKQGSTEKALNRPNDILRSCLAELPGSLEMSTSLL